MLCSLSNNFFLLHHNNIAFNQGPVAPSSADGCLWLTGIEPGMREFEVLEERIEFQAVERAPGTSKIFPGFSLLPRVVVEQKLKRKFIHMLL